MAQLTILALGRLGRWAIFWANAFSSGPFLNVEFEGTVPGPDRCVAVAEQRDQVPFSTFTSDAGIKAVPSRLSAVIALNINGSVIPLILAPYIPSTLHSE